MKKINPIWWVIGGGAILFLMARNSYESILKPFLKIWEGFKPQPYWDVRQWSWGYGTRVPESTNDRDIYPGGSITREQAIIDALNHALNDYQYLSELVKISMNPNRWAALLSFSYNLGPGNADNLMSNLNRGDFEALERQWKQYIYADGQINQNLIDRRNAEWNLFAS